MNGIADGLRLDKWLWHARFFRTRTLAGKACTDGSIRVNRQHVSKANRIVRPGDVLTFPKGRDIRVIRIVALGERRGPAPEAATLYEDLAPPPAPGERRGAPVEAAPAAREKGAGRPTKAERRALDRLKDTDGT